MEKNSIKKARKNPKFAWWIELMEGRLFTVKGLLEGLPQSKWKPYRAKYWKELTNRSGNV